MHPKAQLRVRIILGIIALAALLMIGRLYWLQVVNHSYYASRAAGQYVSPSGGLFDRGTVYFTTKAGVRVSAATVENGFSLAINPEKLTDPAAAFSQINAILPIDRAKFMASAAKTTDPYEMIVPQVDSDTGAKIAALNIVGVIVAKNAWRYYPTGPLASQTVGIVGFGTSSQLTGQYGLEKYYDSTLERNDNDSGTNFFAELFSDLKNTVFEGKSPEGDVVTTIEPSVQQYLDQELGTAKGQWQSTQIGGIVMDPKTGAIYAMDTLPSFDPNDRSAITDPSVLSNPLAQSVYEIGSIVKPLTMSAALDSGVVTADSTYDDTGCVVIDKAKICNYDGKARHVIPMQQILSQSLNVGASHLALLMGSTTMRRYFLSFGLGSTTEIDLPGEQSGLVSNLYANNQVDYATASFGQGIALTPLEVTRALAAIANGGYLVTPHVADEVDYTVGGYRAVDPAPGPRVMSTTTSETVTNMLINVVDQVMVPANPGIAVPHYSVASKTGTAQIPNPATGKYYPDRYLHSFFAYFPAHNPRFIVFMYQVYPKNAEYASATLTKPVFDMVKYLINYYSIPPDR